MLRCRHVRAAVVVVALAMASTGCSGDEAARSRRAGAAPPGASLAPLPVASDAEARPTPGPASPSGTGTRPARSSAFPPASSSVRHGGEFWAVYLAVSRLDASGRPERPEELAEAEQQAEEVGYEGDIGVGDVGCDQGAREALRLDPAHDYQAVSIFFDTKEAADQFVSAFEPPVVGAARIKAFCLD